MDSKDYVYTKMHSTFNDIYKVTKDTKLSKDSKKSEIPSGVENFNTLDKADIDKRINDSVFTHRQSRPF